MNLIFHSYRIVLSLYSEISKWSDGMLLSYVHMLLFACNHVPSWDTVMFICHYWQWPILINCVMCYYLCVLRSLLRPILALNCLLQIEQERSEEESSVGDALALAFRCARFCSISLICFLLFIYQPLPYTLLVRPCHFIRSCAVRSHGSAGMLQSLREALRVSLYRFFWLPLERFPTFLWQTFIRHSGNMACPISEEYVHSTSLPFSGLLCLESCFATWSLEVF